MDMMRTHGRRATTQMVMLSACLAIAGLAVQTSHASQPGTEQTPETVRGDRQVVLAMVLRVGDEEQFVTELDIEEKKTVFNQTTTQRLLQRAEVSMTVEEVTERGSTITVVFNRIAFEAKGEPLNGAFDSRDPSDRDQGNLFAIAMRPIVGAPLRVSLSADRTIQRISGMRDLTPEDPRASLLFESFFSEDSLKNMLQVIFQMKSDPTSARIGEEWSEVKLDQTDFGMLRRTTEYTLASVDEGIARITLGGDVAVTDSMPGNPAATRIESSSVEGTSLWNTRAGRLDRHTAETNAVMKAGDEEFAFTSEIRSRVRVVRAPR